MSCTQLTKMFEEEAQKFVTIQYCKPHEIAAERSTCLLDKMYPSATHKGGTLELELQRCFSEPPEPKDTDILVFWRSQGNLFPILAVMAQNYLAIPANSAPSERVFSGGRRILLYQRASLMPSHVEQLACVNEWARTFGFLFGSTKSMTNHLNALCNPCNPKKQCVSSGTLDKFVQSRHPKKPLSVESLKTALLYFISKCDLPLFLVESPALHTLLELCSSSILSILVHQAALTSHLSKMYFFHQEHLCNILSKNNTFVSCTTDTWISPNVRAFMAVTAHCLNQDFNLPSVILSLIELNGDHSGASLAQHFMGILRQYNLEDQIISITSDNASVNTQMANIIQTMTPAFSADTQTIGCMAHTLHLAAQDGLNTLAQPLPSSGFHQNDKLDLPGPMSIASIVDQPDGTDLNYGLIISQIAQLDSYLSQSPQPREQFVTTMKYFHNYIKSNMLLTNVCTQWNSTYIMLERAVLLKEAYNQFCARANMEQYCLTLLEWDKVRFMINFLQPLDEATGIICGLKYPTINYALPVYISLIRGIH
ncbi:hypothetical protein O181_039871 [Austropuccinia psidii MF-1]|uniref:HAT C-terminal dimerisation domain-containing protein n=1 Tax=Austropuccinia psidii MF-1 TaxID=1389203 RepID=A0A9Q3HCW5_9BASI|nr:hypothetical protein [Austropuccinia psidii MF-1]